MKLHLVRPFRIPFNLPKYRVLANNPKWMQVVAEARSKLSQIQPEFSQPVTLELGNYGWNRPRDVIYDFDYPGWFFKDFYLARLQAPLPSRYFSQIEDPGLASKFDQDAAHWHCWIIDNTMAVLVVELTIASASEFLNYHDQHRDAFRQFNEHWPQTLLTDPDLIQEPVLMFIDWCARHLLKPYSQHDPRFLKSVGLLLPQQVVLPGLPDAARCSELCVRNGQGNLFTQPHPIYNRPFKGLWTHTVYAFEHQRTDTDPSAVSELAEVLQLESRSMGNILGKQHKQSLRQHTSFYGWGWTSLVNNHQAPLRSVFGLEGLVVMQYFYSCFDVADTMLPTVIATSQSHLAEAHHQEVLNSARRSQFELANLVNDYNDLQIRASYEAHIAMADYHKRWRMNDLLQNIRRKQKMMDSLINSASDAIDKRSESGIQMILLGISALSLIGLFASLHEYLSGGYQARFADPLQQWALSWDKWEVTIFTFALLAVLALLAAWMLMRDTIRQTLSRLKRK